jgi:hypothetical protein
MSASFPVDVTDDRALARRLHTSVDLSVRLLRALVDLSVGVLHVAALRSGFGAYNQTTNENRQKDTWSAGPLEICLKPT